MEVQLFEQLYDEMTKAHRAHARAQQAFSYFVKYASLFVRDSLGPQLGLSCEVGSGYLTIKSPITTIRIAFACTADAEVLRASLVVHRIPADPAFEEAILIKEIPFAVDGQAEMKIDNRPLNITIETDSFCLALHLVRLAEKTPLVHRKLAAVTSD